MLGLEPMVDHRVRDLLTKVEFVRDCEIDEIFEGLDDVGVPPAVSKALTKMWPSSVS